MRDHVIVMVLLCLFAGELLAQDHPRIYVTAAEKQDFELRVQDSERAGSFVDRLVGHLDPYVDRHADDPEWIVSRLQMYWKTKYKDVFVNGMDFSHGSGSAPVPTVRFSGSRDWATDYLQPDLEDVLPNMDDPRGMYLQNKEKEGKPWEWVAPSETGHIIERINREILDLAEDASFLYWLKGEEKYAVFAADIFLTYMEGMYHREPPQTVGDHKNALLMGLQTFEVIHEGVIEPLTVCYDFLFDYLKAESADLTMIQNVFRKWADQEIKFGVPGNNWNLMQARFISYLAIVLEEDSAYPDHKGQQYYIDQILNQNSVKQKSLRDVVKNYDPNTAVWPEVASYSMMVTDDILEIFSLLDRALNQDLLQEFPTIEQAVFANFNYLFPNGFTTAYGDAKHRRLRFNSLELLISTYRKYGREAKERLVTSQLKGFIQEGAYSRDRIGSLFHLFYYEEELMEALADSSFSSLVHPTFYSPNVSWIVQRNGHSKSNGMMISKNASLGNHSHTNGINIELYAKGMVVAPDAAAGVSYWSADHRDYYSRFAAHNTVVVDGISDYRNMRGTQAFSVDAIYPLPSSTNPNFSDVTFADVSFLEPSTESNQHRCTGTIRSSPSSGYFIDIFRSSRGDGQDKKHEYLFHGQGEPITMMDFDGKSLDQVPTEELSSAKGDLVGYDYFRNKFASSGERNFIAQYKMPSILGEMLNLNMWMNGNVDREVFQVEAPYSRAISQESVPAELYQKPLPTLVVRQNGEAATRPFVSIIDAFNDSEGRSVEMVDYFSPTNPNQGFVGIGVKSLDGRHDLIFNDINPSVFNEFDPGHFQGRFGIVTRQNQQVHSILLAQGKTLAYDHHSVKVQEDYGDVFIRILSTGYEIDSAQPFIFTIPLEAGLTGSLEIEGPEQISLFRGEIENTNGRRFATFLLPKLTRAKAQLR